MVFESTNYNSDDNNRFNGFSDDDLTIKREERRPSGTYFYIMNFNYTQNASTGNYTKTGYLYIDDN